MTEKSLLRPRRELRNGRRAAGLAGEESLRGGGCVGGAARGAPVACPAPPRAY